MSQFRQFWIYPFKTTKMLFTYLEPNELKKYAPENFDEVHVVEIAALEAAQKEIERLKYENEVYVSLTEPRIEQLTAALKVAEDAIEREMKWRTVKYCTNDGLDNLREALSEIEKIKKGLG